MARGICRDDHAYGNTGADLSLVVILAVLAAFSFAAVRMLRQYFNAYAEVAA
ncbi:hypothetical protein HF265_15930 [Rhizobium leguminosarum]|uniref:hypothetical protein n=1 Tax=Rhizobium leguminosarum TaxID=384 RepID=UPI001C919419|nr:hypothetical protein [Rhizobium leguminosarum]MBY3030581.1 hypothetical protein [Rhizobium leguminosarum]